MFVSLARMDEKTVLKTPVGTAYWPWILNPDVQHDPSGVYKIWLSLPPETEPCFLRQMTELYEAAIEQGRIEKHVTEIKRADPPWTILKDGKTRVFKFKLKASGV